MPRPARVPAILVCWVKRSDNCMCRSIFLQNHAVAWIELVANLMKTYENSIHELSWMTDATKEKALDKLRKITTKIGYPDEWRDYSAT